MRRQGNYTVFISQLIFTNSDGSIPIRNKAGLEWCWSVDLPSWWQWNHQPCGVGKDTCLLMANICTMLPYASQVSHDVFFSQTLCWGWLFFTCVQKRRESSWWLDIPFKQSVRWLVSMGTNQNGCWGPWSPGCFDSWSCNLAVKTGSAIIYIWKSFGLHSFSRSSK